MSVEKNIMFFAAAYKHPAETVRVYIVYEDNDLTGKAAITD
jgi:hypothetical protein